MERIYLPMDAGTNVHGEMFCTEIFWRGTLVVRFCRVAQSMMLAL